MSWIYILTPVDAILPSASGGQECTTSIMFEKRFRANISLSFMCGIKLETLHDIWVTHLDHENHSNEGDVDPCWERFSIVYKNVLQTDMDFHGVCRQAGLVTANSVVKTKRQKDLSCRPERLGAEAEESMTIKLNSVWTAPWTTFPPPL